MRSVRFSCSTLLFFKHATGGGIAVLAVLAGCFVPRHSWCAATALRAGGAGGLVARELEYSIQVKLRDVSNSAELEQVIYR